jgi:hypothetical protein
MTIIDTTTVVAVFAVMAMATVAGLAVLVVAAAKASWASRPTTNNTPAWSSYPLAYWGYFAY